MSSKASDHTIWKITGRARAQLPDDWRTRLAARLGQRPRRIGMLAELALYGALDCLDDAGETILPGDVVLRVCSMCGASDSISQVLEQNRQELPMPFSFLQSQTSQLLPALAAALKWQGDAGIILASDPINLVKLAVAQAGPSGVLLGWVEEAPGSSIWIRLARCDIVSAKFSESKGFAEMVSPETLYWRLGRVGMEIATA